MPESNINQLNTPDDTPKKRPHQESPNEIIESIKEDKKHKTETMNDPVTLEKIMASINSMKESIDNNNLVLNELKASVSGLSQEIARIDTTLTSINNDLAGTKNEIVNIKSRLDVVENSQARQTNTNDEITASINKLMQMNKAAELSIHNLPPELEKEDVISAFSSWSGLKLDEKSFRHSSLVKSKKYNSATLYLNFCNESLKIQFMNIVRSCQKDVNKKYIPLLCESVFELQTNNQSRGVELQFRNSMTNVNREIFNEARKSKSFCAVWIDQGNIVVRVKEGEKPIRLNNMEELRKTIQNIKPRNNNLI